ncbi:MAG TPA: DUF1501 domain-containing protein [Verrucomicrobiales bacterium]|nr:DUF1501 domain-containing protein [Verrucomicrobiales bacterium]
MWTEHTPAQMTRRDALHRLSAGFGAIGLAGMMGTQANAAVKQQVTPKAKRVIFLFMNGAPSHIDTFDPKPALKKYEGQQPSGKLYRAPKTSGFMSSPLKFSKCGQSGIEVSESLPALGSIIDDCCVIRSMHTNVPNHEPALLMMNTGNIQPIRPSLGSWVLYGLGSENENLPGFVVLRPTPNIVVGPALWSNSFLPAEYQATGVITADMSVDKLVANVRNSVLAPAQQRRQIDLIQKLNHLHAAKREHDSALEGQIKAMETAYRMQSAASDAFDISRESTKMRELYGDTPFGRSCLLARRLAESGVRYISVYYTSSNNQPWDTHSDHYKRHPELCSDSDRASAALISDLKQRGLLDDTLVVWTGEFGRTPYSQETEDKNKKVDPMRRGRDHHHTAFSTLLAGGGIKGGLAYGTSDELGMNAEENKVHVHDLHATILHQLGLDHEKLTYRYAGRDFRLTDVYGDVVHDIIA